MRVFLIVLDSFGIGEMPDAAIYGDAGSDTYGHIVEHTGVKLSNMVSLGLNNIDGVRGKTFANGISLPSVAAPKGAHARLAEKTAAKDTTAGHYEIAGLVLDKPFRIYKKFLFKSDCINEFYVCLRISLSCAIQRLLYKDIRICVLFPKRYT